MSGWRFFGYLKLLIIEPPSYSEMAHSYFLLRGRLAFVWRQAHIVGWLSTVGERSVLVIRPYLYRLNRLSSLADTIGSPNFFIPHLIYLSTFLGTALGRTTGINQPQVSLVRQPSKLGLFIGIFNIRGIYPLYELSVSEHLDKLIVTSSGWSQISRH